MPIVVVPVIAAVVLLLAVCACFSGCYTIKQGATFLSYLGQAIPLEDLLARQPKAGKSGNAAFNSGEAETNRVFAERVQDIRSFAMNELGLSMSKNYTRYVQLDRDYIAAIVSACAPDSFTAHKWKFPVVGSMPYKGFFSLDDAYKEKDKLQKKELDVWLRYTDAFSTLGWFKDPLYSYMKKYSVDRLASLIIHELTHATVFVKNNMDFNEKIAEITGTEGARLYIESRFGIDSDEYREMQTGEADSKAFVAFILELAAELEALYAGEKSREEKLAEKA